MPDITITLSNENHRLLSDEYKRMSIAWLRDTPTSLPPSFEQWLADSLVSETRTAGMSKGEVEEMQAVNTIEKLVTALQRHGLALANLGRKGEPGESVASLAETTASNLGFSSQTAKRIQDLLTYYSRNAREIADLAHVSMTNRAYGALHEAYRELVERTTKALDHLGQEQALGRVEGGAAILVGMKVMTRQAAQEKTEAFKQLARDTQK